MDFNLITYKKLLEAIKAAGYNTQTVKSFLNYPADKVFILRHDVNEHLENALEMAIIEKLLGVNSTYYFRALSNSNSQKTIKEISLYGHEIGYHYDDYATCNGNMQQAIEQFTHNLGFFRQFYPVKTVCMRNNSSAKFDNREIWKEKTYNDFDLLGEPDLFIDYSKVLHLANTGKSWNINSCQARSDINRQLKLNSTLDIINALQQGLLPDKIMLQSYTK